MKVYSFISAVVLGFSAYQANSFDYSPPILISGEGVSLDFDHEEQKFVYRILSTPDDPFSRVYYSIMLVLQSEADGLILRASSNRIQFLGNEVVSMSSREYLTEGGANQLFVGGYDVADFGEGWTYIERYLDAPNSWWRRASDLLIGLRFRLEDGVHHGWIRFSRADTHFTTVFQPMEYDWNPIPDAPIGAGQPPVIPIATEVTDQGLHLSWSPSLATWALESTGALTNNAVWVPVPEATGYEALLEFPDASRYFRLRKP